MHSRTSANKVVISLRLDPAEAALLHEIKERVGIPVSEQLRRGMRLWLELEGETKPRPKRKK